MIELLYTFKGGTFISTIYYLGIAIIQCIALLVLFP